MAAAEGHHLREIISFRRNPLERVLFMGEGARDLDP